MLNDNRIIQGIRQALVLCKDLAPGPWVNRMSQPLEMVKLVLFALDGLENLFIKPNNITDFV